MAYDLATGAAAWPEAQQAGFRRGGRRPQRGRVGAGGGARVEPDVRLRPATGVRGSPASSTASTAPSASSRQPGRHDDRVGELQRGDGRAVGARRDHADRRAAGGGGVGHRLDLWSPDGRYVVLFRVDDPSAVKSPTSRTARPTAGAGDRGVSGRRADLAAGPACSRRWSSAPTTSCCSTSGHGAARDTGAVLPRGDLVSNVARHSR